jgi:hypothetical protein
MLEHDHQSIGENNHHERRGIKRKHLGRSTEVLLMIRTDA